FWEKSVLIPVSVAGVELWTRHRSLNMRQLGVLAASVVAPWIGQIVPRMIYGSARPFLPISYWMNLTYFHVYLFSVGLIFGPSIGFFIWLRKRVSPHYLGFLMQIPAWCVIYIVARARLLEMRGLLVLVPCLYPLMAKGLDSLIEHLPNSSGGLVSSDPVHLA
ncbi:MAG TPA: hypothetical protein VMU17_03650, partial [Elusimicrobiota bacterium]|nr:hypothetical protein [Elusimicrobiota bacterium]